MTHLCLQNQKKKSRSSNKEKEKKKNEEEEEEEEQQQERQAMWPERWQMSLVSASPTPVQTSPPCSCPPPCSVKSSQLLTVFFHVSYSE